MKNEVLFSKEIYTVDTIMQAICDYKELAAISVKDTDNSYRVIFTDTVYPLELTAKEFENYIINLTCKKKQW